MTISRLAAFAAKLEPNEWLEIDGDRNRALVWAVEPDGIVSLALIVDLV